MAEGVLPPTKEGIGAMTKLDQLYAERGKKFDEICALLARELGYGEFATISAEDRKQVELEVEQHVKEWEETTEFRTRANIRPITPLRRLLSQHQYICERISINRRSRSVFGHTKEDLGVDASWRLVRACDTAGRWIRSSALFSLEPFAKAVWYLAGT